MNDTMKNDKKEKKKKRKKIYILPTKDFTKINNKKIRKNHFID